MVKESRPLHRTLGTLQRSFSVRLALLVGIFIAVPVIIYSEFRDADAEKVTLLHENTRAEGQLIATALRPFLLGFSGSAAERLAEEVHRLVSSGTVVRILLRPSALGSGAGLFIVAAAPPLPAARLDEERARLIRAGVFDRVGADCVPASPRPTRYTNVSGTEEVLTSLTPVQAEIGCWIVLVSKSADAVLRSSLGRPYWKSTEVRIAAVIYLLFALVVLWMFLDVWRNLRRFARLARDIRTGAVAGGSFTRQNRVPEISGIAMEFDRLVLGLRASARSIREAAEENAHALKGPLAVIAQSVEPLKRLLADNCDAGRAIARIERSTERLDRLVSASRQLDNATAELLEAPQERIDLSALVQSLCESFSTNHEDAGIRFAARIEDGLVVWGNAPLFETVIENVFENAVGFSPEDGMVALDLAADGDSAVLRIADQGPGVEPGNLERIFERYFSHRPANEILKECGEGAAHFGIGLWIVRRNLEAIGGSARARNRPEAGLEITLEVPLAR
ncbi:MAG: HAMP domain-containing sensor histidine kinase [Rhodospirillaceae bacterium]